MRFFASGIRVWVFAQAVLICCSWSRDVRWQSAGARQQVAAGTVRAVELNRAWHFEFFETRAAL